MPVTNPTDAAAEAAESAKRRQSRREERAQNRAASASSDKAAPLSEAQMLNLARGFVVGPLIFRLTCPTIGRASQLQTEIYIGWPQIIVTAASADITGQGIDPGHVATTLTIARRNLYEQNKDSGDEDEEEMPPPAPVMERDIAGMLAQTNLGIEEFLPTICAHVWEMAKDTPGFAYPKPEPPADWEGEEWAPTPPAGCLWLDDAIRQYLRTPDLADLLRALLQCMGGFPGSVVDRFGPPSGANDAA